MLITRPRIWSVTSFCSSVLLSASAITSANPKPKRNSNDKFNREESANPMMHNPNGQTYFWEILIPGSLEGLIVGFLTQRYGEGALAKR